MLRQKLQAALFVPGERKSDRFFRWFPWIWMVAAYCITMGVLCVYGRSYIDSDMASEMILADLLNKEGGLLSTNWWYSTELRVFCLQPFYRVGLLLFPQNWYAARMAGQALCMLVLIAAYLYMGHGLQLKNCGVWGAAALACPFGTWYLWYGPFGGFYLPHMIWILMSFGAILHLARSPKKTGTLLHLLILVCSSAASGLNGVKGLMGFYLPMLLTALVALGLQWHQKPHRCPCEELRVLGTAFGALVVSGSGYLINSTILAAGHSFSNYNGQVWRALDIEGVVVRWQEFLSLFGYPSDSFLPGQASLFSLRGVLGAFGVLTAAAIVFSLIRLLFRWKELQPVYRLAPLLLAGICGVQGLVFACTEGMQMLNASYWLTVVPFAFPVLQIEGETEHFRLSFSRRAAAMAFCVCFVATSIFSMQQFFSQGMRTNPHLEEVCDWLVDQGYTQGYATFWNGSVLTEWSDGQIEVWVTGDFNTMVPDHWLQKTSHSQPPEGKIFLLTTMDELGMMGLTDLYWWSTVVYEDGEQEITDRTKRYIVMEYSSYDDMMAAIQGAQSWAEAGTQGEA